MHVFPKELDSSTDWYGPRILQMPVVDAQARDDPTKNRTVICMDFQNNLPLPLTRVGQEYYKR